MALVNDFRGLEAGIADRFASFFKGLREARHRRSVFRQTLRELNALSNRDLEDMGIHRSMITRVAAEAAYGVKK